MSPPARVAAGVLLCFLAFLPPVVVTVDERSMLAVSLSMLDGTLAVPPDMGSAAADGRSYSNWYPLNSIAALPGTAIARAIAGRLHLPAWYVAAPLGILVGSVATSVTAAFVYALARRLGASADAAVLSGAGYAFGTVLLVYGRSFFAEPLLAALAAAGLLIAARGRSATGHLAVAALSVLAKPTGVVVGGCLMLFHAWRRHWRLAASSAAGTAAGLAVYGGYNWVRFGNPLTFGQQWGGFTMCCVPEAVTGLLISPGRGLLLYCPVAALGLFVVARRLRASPLLALIGGLSVAFLALHAVWGQWQGGWSWGPRLLVPVLPGLVAAAALAPRRLLAATLLVGWLVSTPWLLAPYSRYLAASYERRVSENALVWSVREAPLLHAWGSAADQVRAARQSDVVATVRGAGIADGSVGSAGVYRIVTVWWWMLPLVGLPHWIGAVAAALLLTGGIAILSTAWMGARRPSSA